MPEQWLTYRQLGELWNISTEAARVRCRRANYQRRTNEAGIAEVLVAVDVLVSLPKGGTQGKVNWTSAVPNEGEQDISDEEALRSITALEAEVAALSDNLSQTEQQMETMRQYLRAEREKVSHLMTLLLRSRKQKGNARGILGILLFWRKTPRNDRMSTSHMAPSHPDAMRSHPVAGADAVHFTPYARPDSHQNARSRDHNS